MFLESRRVFLKNSFLSAGVVVFSSNELFGAVSPLETISYVQDDLFPPSQNLESNSKAYLSLVLNHSRISDDDKQFLRNGVQWLNEESLKEYKKIYTKLRFKERQKILKIISKENWGKEWIRALLSHIMEATLGDPIYGINKNEAGWKWLNHTSGLPRPKEALL